jgi:hypothetical protein
MLLILKLDGSSHTSLQLSANARQGQEVGSPAIFPAQSLRGQMLFGEETGDKKLLQNATARRRD